MPTRIAIAGASGRLGSQIADIVEAMPDCVVHARLGSTSELTDMLGADIAIDATNPGVSASIVEFGVRNGIKVLVGTSGWSADKIRPIEALVDATPGAAVFFVPNFSLGATLQVMVSRMLAEHYDSVEIIEAHHIGKADSPSGTAVRTAEEIAQVRESKGGVIAPHTNQSARGEQVQGIPVHSLRLSGVIAEQTVTFGGVGETVRVIHETHSRDAYHQGIIRAIEFLTTLEGVAIGLEHALGSESA